MWSDLATTSCKYEVSPANFWDGVRVWIERPHILNSRLFGMEVISSWKVKWRSKSSSDTALDSDSILMLLATAVEIRQEELSDHLQMFLETVPCEHVFDYMKGPEGPERLSSDLVLQVRKLLPKQLDKHHPVSEILVLDKKENSAVFAAWAGEESGICIPFPYRLMCTEGRIKLSMPKALMNVKKFMEGPVKWLRDVLLLKVLRWSTEMPSTPSTPSLLAVPAGRYSSNYHRLKAKYGKKLVEMWPECTDPLKYVYEDIGIAAYLVTLWEEERKVKKKNELQTFVDLGCGNGLLVYILTSEGHKGSGIDVRKRNIWDCYGPETKLVELALTPSDKMLFPDSDWIIGNHSDELTPWIPVIAARSSYKTRAFVLPCCLYTFDGKYQRAHADKSAYQSYLEFMNELCLSMGFHVKVDKLRIASVRRICFLCVSRNYESQSEAVIDLERTKFIQLHSVRSSGQKLNNESVEKNASCNDISNSEKTHGPKPSQCEEASGENLANKMWASNFQPREKKIPVQNCTHLEPKALSSLISEIMAHLLQSRENFVKVLKDDEEFLWNAGGDLTLEELAKALSPLSLLKLKNQCGGLQTLLRNHRNIFTIDKGKVSLTIPGPSAEIPQVTVPKPRPKRSRVKRKKKGSRDNSNTKPCFFHLHHPGGCPFSTEHCSFMH